MGKGANSNVNSSVENNSAPPVLSSPSAITPNLGQNAVDSQKKIP